MKAIMSDLYVGLIGGFLAAAVAAYMVFGLRRAEKPRNPFPGTNADPYPPLGPVHTPEEIEKKIEEIKNEAENNRPKIDLSPVDVIAVNAKLDRLRAKYKKSN